MVRDYFAILGLPPGRHEPAELDRRFEAARRHWLAALDDPARHAHACRQLEELHVAYRILRHPQTQSEHLEAQRREETTRRETAARRAASAGDGRNGPPYPLRDRDRRIEEFRRLIGAALEDGLLRCSRRQMVLDEGRNLGLSDFQTQLLIAQVQFNDEPLPPLAGLPKPRVPADTAGARSSSPPRAWARFAAAGVLGLALFLAMVRWLGG